MKVKKSPVLILDVKNNKSADKIIQELTKNFGVKEFLLGVRYGWLIEVVNAYGKEGK